MFSTECEISQSSGCSESKGMNAILSVPHGQLENQVSLLWTNWRAAAEHSMI